MRMQMARRWARTEWIDPCRSRPEGAKTGFRCAPASRRSRPSPYCRIGRRWPSVGEASATGSKALTAPSGFSANGRGATANATPFATTSSTRTRPGPLLGIQARRRPTGANERPQLKVGQVLGRRLHQPSLERALDRSDSEAAAEARDLVRKLIETVVVTPLEARGEFALTVQGKIAALVNQDGDNTIKLGAGVGFEPTTFRL